MKSSSEARLKLGSHVKDQSTFLKDLNYGSDITRFTFGNNWATDRIWTRYKRKSQTQINWGDYLL